MSRPPLRPELIAIHKGYGRTWWKLPRYYFRVLAVTAQAIGQRGVVRTEIPIATGYVWTRKRARKLTDYIEQEWLRNAKAAGRISIQDHRE